MRATELTPCPPHCTTICICKQHAFELFVKVEVMALNKKRTGGPFGSQCTFEADCGTLRAGFGCHRLFPPQVCCTWWWLWGGALGSVGRDGRIEEMTWETCVMSETFGRFLLEATAVAEGLSINPDAKCKDGSQCNQAEGSK